MIKSVKVINDREEELNLDLYNPYDVGIAITNITGIGPQKATINTTELAIGDGSILNSAKVSTRNIVMSLQLLPDPETNLVETVRHRVYKYFPLKSLVTLVFYTDTRNLKIQGYVESNEPDIFQKAETIQISILCVDPWFYIEVDSIPITGSKPLFEFPFSNESLAEPLIEFGEQLIDEHSAIIDYIGEVPTGLTFTIVLDKDTASNIKLFNDSNDERMIIDTSNIGKIMGSEKKLPLACQDRQNVASLGDMLYTFSGRYVYAYNTQTTQWNRVYISNYPYSNYVKSTFVYKNKIYLLNYYLLRFSAQGLSINYDTSVSPSPLSTTWQGVAVTSNRIYAVGDTNGQTKTMDNGMFQYTVYKRMYAWINDSSWSAMTDIPYNYYAGKAIADNDGKIHVMGSEVVDYERVRSGAILNIENPRLIPNATYCKTPMTYILSPLLDNKYTYQALSLNGELHVMGGETGLYHYKWNGTSWTQYQLPKPFIGKCTACVYNNEIYIYGGFDGSYCNNYMYKWNGYNWEEILHDGDRPAPDKTGRSTMVNYNGSIYIIGACNHDIGFRHVYKVTFQTNWDGTLEFYLTRIGSLPADYMESSCWNDAVIKDNYVYILLDDGYLYRGNTSLTSWTRVSSNSIGIDSYIFYINGKIYAYDLGEGFYIYNESSTRWDVLLPYSQISNYVLPKKGAVYNGNICLFDCDSYVTVDNSKKHYIFDPNASNVWTQSIPVPYSFHHGEAVLLNGEIHILGGGEGLRSHYKLDASSTSWTFVSNMPYPFKKGSAVVDSQNRIHLYGGIEENTSYNHWIWDGTSWSVDKDSALQPGDKLYLSTTQNHKYLYGIRGDKEYNLMSALPKVSDWIHLKPGDNIIRIDADSGVNNLKVEIDYKLLYEGV